MGMSAPALLIFPRVLLFHVLPNVVYANIYFTAGISSVCGDSLIAEILRFISRGKTDTSPIVRQLNNSWYNIPLLVLVTVSGSLVRSPCASLAVAVFNSYPQSCIFKSLVSLNSSSDFSRLSLVNIAFYFFLCELDVRLNASAVTLLASVIDSSSYYLITFKVAS